MSNYEIVAALWEDHTEFRGAELPLNLDELIIPTLSIGFLYKETERFIVLVSDVERTEYIDACNFTVILKAALIGPLKEYGTIEVTELRIKEGSK